MKRLLLTAAAAAAISLLIITPVMAAYYVEIDVTESNGTDYTMLAMNATLDVNYLADNEFIAQDGLDTRLVSSAGGSVPFMLQENQVYFTSSLTGDRVTTFTLNTGNTPRSDFEICTGDGGYVTFSDHSNLELGVDFEIELDGWFDTSQAQTFLEKTDVIKVETAGSDDISATIYCPDDMQCVTDDASLELYSGALIRFGERIDDFPQGTVTQLSFWIGKLGSPTGTAYVRCRRVSDDGIVGTFGSIDVTTMGSVKTWYDFTDDVYVPSTQDLRFTLEYDGGDGSNCIRPRYEANSNGFIGGQLTYYDSSWTDSTGDASFKLLFSPDIVLSASSVSPGESAIKVTGDGTDLKLFVNDAEQDTASSALIVDNSNDWDITDLPYANFYKHTTSDTLRITYEPDSIITGTTLPNETSPGTYDGVITWGDNPAGVTAAESSLLVDETYVFTEISPGDQDIIDSEPATLVGRFNPDLLERNPLNPLVQTIEDTTDLPASLIWTGSAYILLFVICVAVLLISRENIMFTVLAGLGWASYCYLITVFDLWIVLLFAFGAIAAIVHERMPTW